MTWAGRRLRPRNKPDSAIGADPARSGAGQKRLQLRGSRFARPAQSRPDAVDGHARVG